MNTKQKSAVFILLFVSLLVVCPSLQVVWEKARFEKTQLRWKELKNSQKKFSDWVVEESKLQEMEETYRTWSNNRIHLSTQTQYLLQLLGDHVDRLEYSDGIFEVILKPDISSHKLHLMKEAISSDSRFESPSVVEIQEYNHRPLKLAIPLVAGSNFQF